MNQDSFERLTRQVCSLFFSSVNFQSPPFCSSFLSASLFCLHLCRIVYLILISSCMQKLATPEADRMGDTSQTLCRPFLFSGLATCFQRSF